MRASNAAFLESMISLIQSGIVIQAFCGDEALGAIASCSAGDAAVFDARRADMAHEKSLLDQ